MLIVATKGITLQKKNKAPWRVHNNWVSVIIQLSGGSASGPVKAVTLLDRSLVGAGWALGKNGGGGDGKALP